MSYRYCKRCNDFKDFITDCVGYSSEDGDMMSEVCTECGAIFEFTDNEKNLWYETYND